MRPRKQGATYPITAQLLVNGVPVDLTGSSVTISMRDASSHVVKILDAAVAVTSPTTGAWSYTPLGTDVDTPATYQVEVHETRADGSKWRYPSHGYEPLIIEEALA